MYATYNIQYVCRHFLVRSLVSHENFYCNKKKTEREKERESEKKCFIRETVFFLPVNIMIFLVVIFILPIKKRGLQLHSYTKNSWITFICSMVWYAKTVEKIDWISDAQEIQQKERSYRIFRSCCVRLSKMVKMMMNGIFEYILFLRSNIHWQISDNFST